MTATGPGTSARPHRRGRPFASAVAVAIAAAITLAACAHHAASTSGTDAPAATTFVLARHAEKASGAADPRDPPLSPAGAARAEALATKLADTPLAAIYATPYRRTRDTAAPIAAAHGITVTVEDPADDAGAIAARLRARHAAGTVLVVGHSNTVPPLAAALCGCEVAPIPEDAFGDLFVIEPGDDGRPRLRRDRFGP